MNKLIIKQHAIITTQKCNLGFFLGRKKEHVTNYLQVIKLNK